MYFSIFLRINFIAINYKLNVLIIQSKHNYNVIILKLAWIFDNLAIGFAFYGCGVSLEWKYSECDLQ